MNDETNQTGRPSTPPPTDGPMPDQQEQVQNASTGQTEDHTNLAQTIVETASVDASAAAANPDPMQVFFQRFTSFFEQRVTATLAQSMIGTMVITAPGSLTTLSLLKTLLMPSNSNLLLPPKLKMPRRY